jgi:hypothetical protein
MKEEGVVYMIQGRRHQVVLAVSVWTLRQHYDGPVTIICTDDEGQKVAGRICDDSRSGCEMKVVTDCASGRHSGYLNKTRVVDWTPYRKTVFIDADTTVAGSLDRLFPIHDEVVLTSFSDWTSLGRRLRPRIMKWDHVEACEEDIAVSLKRGFPMINTGVFGFTKKTKVMEDWYDYTAQNVSFICDEIAMQLMFPRYPARVLSDAFNCSPFYGLHWDESVVRHYHGRKHLRPGNAVDSWWPAYKSAVSEKFANLHKWTPAGDNRLKDFLKKAKK